MAAPNAASADAGGLSPAEPETPPGFSQVLTEANLLQGHEGSVARLSWRSKRGLLQLVYLGPSSDEVVVFIYAEMGCCVNPCLDRMASCGFTPGFAVF